MFHIVEYRTTSRIAGHTYTSRFARVGMHKAQTDKEAAAYILRTTQNVEIVGVQLVGATG